jgi:polynucleotide 5'-kinase involved in rRNA processing
MFRDGLCAMVTTEGGYEAGKESSSLSTFLGNELLQRVKTAPLDLRQAEIAHNLIGAPSIYVISLDTTEPGQGRALNMSDTLREQIIRELRA